MKKILAKTGISLILGANMLGVASAEADATMNEAMKMLISAENRSLSNISMTEEELQKLKESMNPHEFAQKFEIIRPKSEEKIEEQTLESAPMVASSLFGENAIQSPLAKNTEENAGMTAWKLVHCQMFFNGFEWLKPTSDYITRSQCGLTDAKNSSAASVIFPQISSIVNFVKKTETTELNALAQFEKVYNFLQKVKTEMDFLEELQIIDSLETRQKARETLAVLDKKIFQEFQNEKKNAVLTALQKKYFALALKVMGKIDNNNEEYLRFAIKSEEFPLFAQLLVEYKDIAFADPFTAEFNDYSNEKKNGFDLYRVFGADNIQTNRLGTKFAIPLKSLRTKMGDEISLNEYNVFVKENPLGAVWNMKYNSVDFSFIQTDDAKNKNFVITVMFLPKNHNAKRFEQDIVLVNTDKMVGIKNFVDYFAQ